MFAVRTLLLVSSLFGRPRLGTNGIVPIILEVPRKVPMLV